MVIRSVKSLIFIIIQIGCVVYLIVSSKLLPESIVLRLLIAFAGVFAVWSILLINKFMNVAPDVVEGSKLIKVGPYRYIRHPMYLSLLIVCLCLIIDYFTLLRLLVVVLLFIAMVLKMSHEENLLEEAFPEYEEYKLRTKRIIPFLY